MAHALLVCNFHNRVKHFGPSTMGSSSPELMERQFAVVHQSEIDHESRTCLSSTRAYWLKAAIVQ